MKRKNKLIVGLVALTLTIGAGAFAASNKSVFSVSAEAYNDKVSIQNGYFKKVTDVSSIQNNEKLLLVARDNLAIQFFVGASMHYFVTTEHWDFKYYSEEYIFLNNDKAELVTFVKTGDANNSFRLKLEHFANYTSSGSGRIDSGYLVHEHYDNDGVTSYGDLYFRTSVDSPNPNQARWTLEYDGSHMRITSLSGRLLHWKGGSTYIWDSLIASTHTEWDSDINLYRYIGDDDGTFTNVIPPDRYEYNKQDVLNLHGFGARVMLDGGDEYDILYDNCPRFFDVDTEIDYEEDEILGALRHATYLPNNLDLEFTINIVPQVQRSYTIMNTALMNDIRGTYIAVAESYNVAYYAYNDAYDQYNNGNVISLSGCGLNTNTHMITSPSYDLYTYGYLMIQKEYHVESSYSGWYNTKVFSTRGKSISYCAVDEHTTDWDSYIRLSNDEWTTPFVRNAELHFMVNDVDYALRYNNVKGRFMLSNDTNYEAAKLYRLDINSQIMKEMNDWREYYFDSEIRSRCSSSGNTGQAYLDVIRSKWGDGHYRSGTIEQAFYTNQFLSPDGQSYLARLIYTHNGHAYDTLESMIDCYDFMVVKYGLYDFMFRQEAGTLYIDPNPGEIDESALYQNLMDALTNRKDVTISIIVIGAVSIASLFVLIILKKKRAHK